jgi:hypothetical protein
MTVSDLAPGAVTVATAAPGRPRSSDLMRVLTEIESTVPVADWMVAGIPIWPLLRVRWFFGEWARQYGTAGSAARSWSGGRIVPVLRGAADAARARRNDATANDDQAASRDLIFLSDGLSFARLGEHWVERFCDPLIRAAARQGASSALWTPQHRYHVPRATPSAFVQPAIDRANLAGMVQSRLAGREAKRLPDRARAAALLRARGLDDAALSLSRIASDGCRLLAVSTLFERRLAAVRPRLAFVVGYYSLEAMAFVHACRRLVIPVVDIQHGVQGEFHPGYAAWPALQRGRLHALVPDRFWVWSDWEGGIVDAWAAGSGHAAIVGGNPWLDVWRGDADWPGAREALSAAARLRERAGGRPVVLVTLQFGLGPEEQLEPLRRLIVRASERYAFWVRLHPVMASRRGEVRTALGAAGAFELDAASDLPLHALLPVCDVHLTHSSSTVIEAEQFAVPSVITSAYGGELFTPSVHARAAVVETGDAAAVDAALGRLLRERADTALPPSRTDAALAALLAYARRHPHRSDS